MAAIDPTLKHAITPPAFDKSKLHREALVDRIHAALDKPLVVVAAPAGYGKTTLLADFTAHSDQPVCWIRLPDTTSIDVQFMASLIAETLRRRFRRLKKKAAPRINASTSAESAARTLGAWIEENLDEYFTLVVDDAHVLNRSSASLAFLDELIELRPNDFTLVLSGREVADLSLARFMAEGGLVGFGPQDLSFGGREIQELTALLTGVQFSDQEVKGLEVATRGWVTGIVLAGVLARRTLGQGGSVVDPFVYDYLASTVLNRLPDELRSFALESSVLPSMTASACDEVLGRTDSGRLLPQLARKGAFIDVTSGDPRTYEFHPLFRSFLVETLSGSNESLLTKLRAKAAAYFDRIGAPDYAFRLFMEGNSRRKALRVASQSAEAMLAAGRVETMRAWWDSLQEVALVSKPLGLALATALVDQGILDEAERILGSTDRGALKGPMPLLSTKVESLRAEIHFQRGEYSACLSLVDKALGPPSRKSDPYQDAIACRLKALALVGMGRDSEEARKWAKKAVDLAARTPDKRHQAKALMTLSYVLDATGDHRGSNTEAERAYNLLRDVGSAVELASALNNLGEARHKEGRYDDALLAYGEALKHARRAASPLREAYILFGQADLFSDVGMAMEAASLYGEALSIATRLDNEALIHYGCLKTSVLYRRRGNFGVANDWLRRGIEVADTARRQPGTTIQVAALELTVSTKKATETLAGLLHGRGKVLSAEEQSVALLFLVKGSLGGSGLKSLEESVEKLLSVAGVGGAEQVLAAELMVDQPLQDRLRSVASGNPVLAVILGRIETMRIFRALHGGAAVEKPERLSLAIVGFGPGEVIAEGRPVKTLKPQAKEVLFYLVDRKAAAKEELAETFWPRLPSGRRAANIHTTIHGIRRVLGKTAVGFSDGVYTVGPDAELSYDVGQFEKAASVAERLTPGDPRRLFALTEAISTYRGPFLSDTDTEWAVEKRRSLELRYLDMMAQLSSEALVRDQPEKAVDVLRRALMIDPMRDDFNYGMLDALGRLGRVSEVVTHYEQYTSLLRQELGIEPPEPTRKLYSRIIR